MQYGASVQSLAVYINTYQFVPYACLTELFWDLFGVRLWVETAKRALDMTAEKLLETAEAIKNAVIRSTLAHFDEVPRPGRACRLVAVLSFRGLQGHRVLDAIRAAAIGQPLDLVGMT